MIFWQGWGWDGGEDTSSTLSHGYWIPCPQHSWPGWTATWTPYLLWKFFLLPLPSPGYTCISFMGSLKHKTDMADRSEKVLVLWGSDIRYDTTNIGIQLTSCYRVILVSLTGWNGGGGSEIDWLDSIAPLAALLLKQTTSRHKSWMPLITLVFQWTYNMSELGWWGLSGSVLGPAFSLFTNNNASLSPY